MKKIIIATILFSLCSCAASEIKQEAVKSAKASAASNRINQSNENSSKLLKELDE
jgi:hypothetical protein